MTKQAEIQHLPTGDWWLDTGETVYRVSSINAHCTRKLQSLHDAHTPVYMTLAPITEYASDEYRTRLHASTGDWDDSDVYCLVREVLTHPDGTPVTDAEIDAEAERLIIEALNTGEDTDADKDEKQLIFDAFMGLADDGIFEIVVDGRSSDEV